MPLLVIHRLLYLHSMLPCLKVGVGMSMEGIEQNPVVYDLMSEMAFHHYKVDVKVHVASFSYLQVGIYLSIYFFIKIFLTENTTTLQKILAWDIVFIPCKLGFCPDFGFFVRRVMSIG